MALINAKRQPRRLVDALDSTLFAIQPTNEVMISGAMEVVTGKETSSVFEL